MRLVRCSRELEIEQAARAGELDQPMREHLRTCASCADLVRVSAWMRDFAALPLHRALPDPSQVWWKAQLVRRWEAERRAAAPIDAMQHVETGAGLVALVVLFYLFWPRVEQWLVKLAPPWADLGLSAPGSAMTIVLAMGGAMLAAVTAAILAEWMRERDEG